MEELIAIVFIAFCVWVLFFLFLTKGDMAAADKNYRECVVDLLVSDGWTYENAEKKVDSFKNIYALRSWQENL